MFSSIGPIGSFAACVVLIALYLVPSIVAFNRSHPKRWLVLVINLVFGGTLVGWVVALYLATRPVRARVPV
ncbi:superinfection immunity protein [Streptomyces luteireticuli]|uniref:Superinfection immunity protein n=1 Tax=Streptomyces luteireticuli TaxID=173858 RepID=A0ABN0Z6J4_9ACTN